MTHLKSILLAGSMMLMAGPALAQMEIYGAVLPTGRTAQVGQTVTAYASMINNGDDGIACRVILSDYADKSLVDFHYQAYANDGITPEAGVDKVVAMNSGDSQIFVLSFTPLIAFDTKDIPLKYRCSDPLSGLPTNAPIMIGTNTFQMTAMDTAPPDILAVAETPSGDAVLRIPTIGSAEAMGLSAINLGAATAVPSSTPAKPQANEAYVVVQPGFGSDSLLPFTLSICETNPADALCLAAPSDYVTTNIGDSVKTFSVFATANGESGTPLYPDLARIEVQFRDNSTGTVMSSVEQSLKVAPAATVGGTSYGRTGLAVTAPGPALDARSQNSVGPEGPYEVAMVDGAPAWYRGKGIGFYRPTGVHGIAFKVRDEQAAADFYYFDRYTIPLASGDTLQTSYTSSNGISFMVYDNPAYATERRTHALAATWEQRKGFDFTMAQAGYEENDGSGWVRTDPPFSGSKHDPRTARAAINMAWPHDIAYTSDLLGTYQLQGDAASSIVFADGSPYDTISGSFTGPTGTCTIEDGTYIAGTNNTNAFQLGFYIRNCETATNGFYFGYGARMFENAGSVDPNSLWALVYRQYDGSGQFTTNDNPMELILEYQLP